MNKVQLKFNNYYTYAELNKALEELSEAYPNLCQLGSIGTSWEGREVCYVTLTNTKTGPAADKPAIYIDGNTHAGEVTGSMAALYTINYLLSNYPTDNKVKKLLDNYTFYIIPRVNPDGAELYLTTPHMLRSSVRPWPKEGLSELPGLHAEDIDGNGYILQMRKRDDNRGEWKVSKRDPRLMIPRLLDDTDGPFYHVYKEGYVKDYEGEPFEMNPVPWGLDLNRNYPSEWNREIKGGGDYPTSEPEIKNVVDFILGHKNIGALEALHTSGGILFRSPYTYTEAEMDQDDLNLLKTIGQRGEDLTGYPDVPSTGGIFAATIVDWAYEHCAIPGFTPELWDLDGRAGVKMDWHQRRKLSASENEERELKILQWNDRELSGKGFFNWEKFDHPQLGEVEIGGWNPKFVRQNPPVKLLEQECYKMCRFLLAHATALPKVVIEEVKVQAYENDIFKIQAVVGNHGFLPTNLSSKGKKIKVIAQDKVCLELPKEGELLIGKQEVEIGYLEGYYNGQQGYTKLPAKSVKKVEFMLKAPAHTEATLTVISEKGGTVRKTIELA